MGAGSSSHAGMVLLAAQGKPEDGEERHCAADWGDVKFKNNLALLLRAA